MFDKTNNIQGNHRDQVDDSKDGQPEIQEWEEFDANQICDNQQASTDNPTV